MLTAETDTLISPDKAEQDLRAALNPTPANNAQPTEKGGKSELESQQTATTEKAVGDKPNQSLTTDTQATAERVEAGKTQTETTGVKKSEFAKANERKDTSWKALNADKEKFAQEKAEFENKVKALQDQERRFSDKQAQSKAKVTPEQHEEAARQHASRSTSFNEQADAWDARAEKMESEGKDSDASKARDNAKALRKEANRSEALADLYKSNAEHARKNPDPTAQQTKTRIDQQLTQYTMEAAKLWPEIAKSGSEFQNKVATNIRSLREQGLDENEFPVLRYHAARFAALESDAARVPDLEKKLGAAEARVKELEKLTVPGGGQSAAQTITKAETDFSKMSLSQQEAWLRNSVSH